MPESDAQGTDDELSGLRIRHITTMRRFTSRTRSYYIIGAVGCSMLAIELARKIARFFATAHGRFSANPWPAAAAALLALAALAGSVYFLARAIELTRELRRPLMEEPETEPDFSGLSDGSQHVRDLETMVARALE